MFIAQIGVGATPQAAADRGGDAVREGYGAWVIVGGIALLLIIFGAWWYSKHG